MINQNDKLNHDHKGKHDKGFTAISTMMVSSQNTVASLVSWLNKLGLFQVNT